MSYWESFVGKTLSGRYRLDRLIGYGGFGAVFEAEDLDLADRVAVKVMQSELAGQVRREAVLARRFKHPNAVRVENIGADGETPYIVMELLNGRTLDRLGRLGPDRIRQLVRQIGGALHAAHGQNLVHRDLKPQNIMLVDEDAPTERFVILDFGIAAQIDVQSTLRGATMDGAGTPEYMSPQQLIGADPTPQTDIYSFGVVLYWLLNGSLPFPCGSNSLVQYYNYVVDHEPPPFRELNPESDVNPAIEELVRQCLAKEPNQRPAGMLELVEAFLRIDAAEGVFGASFVDAVPNPTARSEDGAQGGPTGTLIPDDGNAIAVADPAASKSFGTTDHHETRVETQSDAVLAASRMVRQAETAPRRSRFFGKSAAATVLGAVVLAGGLAGYPQIQKSRVQSTMQTMIEQGDYRSALQAIQAVDPWTQRWLDAEELQLQVRQAGLQRAGELADAGQWEAALGEYRKLNELFPDDSDVNGILANMARNFRMRMQQLARADKFEEANEALASKAAIALGSVNSALDVESVRGELLTQGLQQVEELANASQHLESLEQARRLQAIFGNMPELEEWLRREQAQVLVLQADDDREKRDFDEAVAAYAQAFELATDVDLRRTIRRKQIGTHRDAARNAVDQSQFQDALKFIAAGLDALDSDVGDDAHAMRAEFHLLRGRAARPSDPRAAVCDFLAAEECESTASRAKAALDVVAVEYGQMGIDRFQAAEQAADRQQLEEADAQYQAAIDALGIAILAKDEAAELYYYRGFARSELQEPDYAGAISDLDRFRQTAARLMQASDSETDVAQLFTRYLITLSRLAWLKSTSPVDGLRQGEAAVQLAREAVEGLAAVVDKDAERIELRLLKSTAYEALAAAYAETGEFEKAISTTKQIQAEFLPDEPAWQYHQQRRTEYYEKKRPIRDVRPPSARREPAPCTGDSPETPRSKPGPQAPVSPRRIGGNDRSVPGSPSPVRK